MRRSGPLRRGARLRSLGPSRPLLVEARKIIYVRADGRCELCGRRLTFAALQSHHRLGRRHGEDCPCNLLALCGDCHTAAPGAVHRQVAISLGAGRIVSRYDDRPRAAVPVALRLGPVLLACDGTLAPVRGSGGWS